MTLWRRSQIHVRGFEFETRTLYVVEFKLLSLFCD